MYELRVLCGTKSQHAGRSLGFIQETETLVHYLKMTIIGTNKSYLVQFRNPPYPFY